MHARTARRIAGLAALATLTLGACTPAIAPGHRLPRPRHTTTTTPMCEGPGADHETGPNLIPCER